MSSMKFTTNRKGHLVLKVLIVFGMAMTLSSGGSGLNWQHNSTIQQMHMRQWSTRIAIYLFRT